MVLRAVPRFAAAIALAAVLQASVTLISRLVVTYGGGYGAPIPVGRVSALIGQDYREARATFDPWIFLVNLVLSAAVIFPALPSTRIPRALATGLVGGSIGFGIWFGLLGPAGLPALAISPSDRRVVIDPFALWAILLVGALAGVFLWRRREGASAGPTET